ncbi:MAG: LPS assembly protein LptD [Desulfobacterales bacterium]|nr:LPS assembly protein LptD [Desulfobacterales bacterium]
MSVADRWICSRLTIQRPRPLFVSSFVLLILCFFLFSNPAVAQTPDLFFRDDPEKPWHITADEIKYDEKDDLYIAQGSVVITKGEKKITADSVRFYHKAMQAHAAGNVIITTGEDTLNGNRVELDLKTETGTIHEGSLFIKENHFYIRGDKIQKTGDSTYIAENVSISTCDGQSPDWKITGRNLEVTIEGYGTVTHAALWAKKLPVLYTPYLFFPVKLKRQSGLLPPQIGLSDRKGFEYIQPYFWAISDSTDATFFLHHMAERGEKIGAEYRYILKDLSKGTARYDFHDDRRIDDGTADSSKDWGYEDDAVLRPNSDRYWFRMKNDQKLPYNFNAKIDLDVVSDQDYLTEFKTGYTGFDETSAYYFDTFGRGLDDYNDTTRVNSLNINRIWPNFSLNAETRWNDNVVYRRQETSDPTLQQLPSIGLYASKQSIGEGPFFYDMNTSYTYFYREEGTKGHRGDIYPRFYLPYKFKNYLAIEPSLGLRATTWYTDPDETDTWKGDRFDQRGLYDVTLDLSSDLNKVFAVKFREIDRIKHALRPQVVYEYIPHVDQDQFPSYDSIDQIAEKNLLTYSLTNLFTSRSKKTIDQTQTDLEKQDSVPSPYLYHQFSRLKLQQSYDINKANDHEPEPFSPISGEFDWVLSKYFSLQADASWTQYRSEFLTHNIATSFSDSRGDRLFVEHRYAQGQSETIYTDLRVNLTHGFSAYSDYERNILDGKKIQSSLGVIYTAQCWSLNVRYTDQEADRKFEFIISLRGLGEAGTSIAGRSIETPFK